MWVEQQFTSTCLCIQILIAKAPIGQKIPEENTADLINVNSDVYLEKIFFRQDYKSQVCGLVNTSAISKL